MNKKAIALIIGSALAVPSAFAAQDTSGMHFTSASEGFYASIRARLDFSGGSDDANSNIDGNSSRFGVRGTNDLGGGLEGFYQYEAGFKIESGGYGDNPLRTRLGLVGLRGNFGELMVGSFWSNDYNWVHGSTDVANNYSGYLVYNDNREGRTSKSIQYTTPNLNGFQGALRVRAQGDGEVGGISGKSRGLADANDFDGADRNNDVDAWNISAIYEIQGFSIAGSYQNRADGLTTRDALAEDAARAAFEASAAAVTAYTATLAIQRAVPANNTNVDGLAANSSIADLGSAIIADEALAVVDAEAATTSAADRRLLSQQSDAIIGVANSLLGAEDATSWSVRLGYAQDNWYVNGWYGEDNTSDVQSGADDTETFSIAGGVSLDKVNLYALYEQQEQGSKETAYGTLGVQYSLGAQSRVWLEYFSQDVDGSDPKAEDIVSIGLRHDF